MKYAFIRDELAGTCTVRMACRLLEVSPSGYHRFLKAPVAARKVRRLAVEDAVVRIHAESRRIYGAPKIAHEEARLAVFEWIEVWYQRTRIHGSLGYVSPEAFEAAASAG